MNFDQLVESGFVEIVSEPEYSFSQLKKFEEKYKISTISFYEYHQLGFFAGMPDHHRDFKKWAYNYDIFLEAGGAIQHLIENQECSLYDTQEGDCHFPSCFILDGPL